METGIKLDYVNDKVVLAAKKRCSMKKRGQDEELGKSLTDSTRQASQMMELSLEEINALAEEADRPSSFLETARIISSVVQPKQPSEELIARVSHAVQERFRERISATEQEESQKQVSAAEQEESQEQMSAEKIQRIIGMAATDEAFRESFFQDIDAACRSVGINLTPSELAALKSLREDAVREFANSLDERITKFFLTGLL